MRINLITSLIDECKVLMDVGCDHGLVVARAIKSGLCTQKAYAVDISDICLDKARRNLEHYEIAECVCANGIADVELKPDFIVICGMGGNTISDILHNYIGSATLLLSPHSHPELVRKWLAENGYAREVDECYEFRNKFYDIIKAKKSVEYTIDELSLKYGNYKAKSESLKRRLERQLSKLRPDLDKYKEIEEVLKWQE